MVVFDEAHHARYLEVTNPQRRRDNSYLRMLKHLSVVYSGVDVANSHPDANGPFGVVGAAANPRCQRAVERGGIPPLLRHSTHLPTLEDWNAARQVYLRDGMAASARTRSLSWREYPVSEASEQLDYIRMPASSALVLRRDMTPERIRGSMSLMRRSSSIKRSVSRHTRNLLRQYAQEGRLSQSVPQRNVLSVAVEMTENERSLYDDIRALVRECYQGQANVNRQALGFVMTHFRLRLGSSLYAFRRSLEDLYERMQTGHSEAFQWDDLPVTGEDDYSDLDPETGIPSPEPTSSGQRMLSDLQGRCRAQVGPDSKFVGFLDQLAQLRSDGYTKVMVFSQFRDTQVWLREQLAKEAGEHLLAGLSGTDDWVFQPENRAFLPESREKVVQQFRERQEGILLCTETAAESLNFQFCSAIINYDIPWNPMRLEQRIGRIDRIGQREPFIRIVHLFYRDTVEYDAYTAMEERIREFQENVGTLQPILAANLESVIRESVMDGGASRDVKQAVHNLAPPVGFDLDDLAAAAADQQDPAPLLHMNDLTYILNHPEWLPDGYAAERRGDRHWRVTTPGGKSHTVTTDRASHDYAAGTVEFFGPGNPAFPVVDGEKGELAAHRSVSEVLGGLAGTGGSQ